MDILAYVGDISCAWESGVSFTSVSVRGVNLLAPALSSILFFPPSFCPFLFTACLLFFSLALFLSLSFQWSPEVKHHCAGIPIILVGTKLDLREDKEETNKLESEGKSPLKYVDGLKLKRKIGAEKYLECSAKTMTNVHQIFEEAIRAALVHMNPKPTKRRRCTLL